MCRQEIAMTPTPLDNGPANDNHGHEGRITRLEVRMNDLACEVALLRQHVDEGFRSVRELIQHTADLLREEQRHAIDALRLEFRNELQKAVDKLNARMDEMEKHHDAQFRWMVGLLIATLLSVLTLVPRSV
jgi:hypothetical protein